MARKPNYKTLETMYAERDRRLSAYELYVHLLVQNHDPVRARINQDETEYQDEFYTAQWMGADLMGCGVVLIVQHYGSRGSTTNSTVLDFMSFESACEHDGTYRLLLERLKTARYRALTVDEEGFSRIQQTA